MEERHGAIMEKVEEVVNKSEFVRKHQSCLCYTCYLITMLLAIVYVVGLLICIVIYVMAAQQVIQIMDKPSNDSEVVREQVIDWLDGSSTYYNLPATVSFTLHGISSLLTENADDLIFQVNGTMNTLRSQLGVSHLKLLSKTHIVLASSKLIFVIISRRDHSCNIEGSSKHF